MRTSRRTPTILLMAVLAMTLLAPGALAATGPLSSGTDPVVAEDRTPLELAAEGYAIKAHNDQRASGATRNGVRYGDVDSGPALVPYSDMMTVSRSWADHIGPERFLHNPDYSHQFGHWAAVGENIATSVIKAADGGEPSRRQVVSETEQLLQALWNSTGHRVNWMRDTWQHVSVGASVRVEQVMSTSGPRDAWILSLVVNFRRHDGSRIGGVSFRADGSAPPNESTARGQSAGPTGGGTSRPSFGDVPADHVFAAPIARLAASGVTRGCGSDRFCPDDHVTRGQMAAFLTRALDLPADDRTFSDTRGHLFASPVAALARAGITTGCNPGGGNTRFCPDDAVTRGQMAAFLTRALDLPAGTSTFTDTRGHVFASPIAALARAGITAGCNPAGGNTRFCPDEPVTRAQMAAFLARAGVLD